MSISERVEDIKQVPQDCADRERLREAASAFVADLPAADVPGDREGLEALGDVLLARLGLPREWLGFAMVAVDNAIWRDDFAAVPLARRLFLLPKCLSSADECRGQADADGLHCAGCGRCELAGLKEQAEVLGYGVIIAEGTTAVVSQVLEGHADAVLGVACLDSLEKSFERIAEVGIPHQAVPLLRDGCVNTEAELDQVRALLHLTAPAGAPTRRVQRTYLPLLRFTRDVFETQLDDLLTDCFCLTPLPAGSREPLLATDAIARDWLLVGGKRLRPFITVAAYAVAAHGPEVLSPRADLGALLPGPVRALAVAIEALHKASLVHDDIEDADQYRYGRPTIHQAHGLEAAINVGDYLVGLGYRLIASQAEALGAACASDILGKLSAAHLRLCCGQGAELMWNSRPHDDLEPLHALQIASLKTAPAFEAALYAGLRAAGPVTQEDALAAFSRYLGEGYQVLNDLEDWDEGNGGKLSCGRDFAAGRPTVLRSFAVQAGAVAELGELRAQCAVDAAAAIRRVRELYREVGAFERAEVLYERLRGKALETAETLDDAALAPLLRFLARTVLRRRFPDRAR
jgi:geranylgeranyl diphosphate synthase type II